MILTTTQKLQINMGEAKTTSETICVVGYTELTLSGNSVNTILSVQKASVGNTAQDLLTAPSAGYSRKVLSLFWRNIDTVTHTFIIQMTDSGASTVELAKITLLTLEALSWTCDGGWQVLDVNGAIKTVTSGQTYVGTTQIPFNRASAAQALTGITGLSPAVDSTTAMRFFKADGVTSLFTLDTSTPRYTFGTAGTGSSASTAMMQVFTSQGISPAIFEILADGGGSVINTCVGFKRNNVTGATNNDGLQIPISLYDNAGTACFTSVIQSIMTDVTHGGVKGALTIKVKASGDAATSPTEYLRITDTGQLKIKGIIFPYADSTTALQLCKADGSTPLLTMDSTNSLLQLCPAATSTNGVVIGQTAAPAANYILSMPNTSTKGAQGYVWATYSDTRIKLNQRPLEYGLSEVLRLAAITKRYEQHDSSADSGSLVILDTFKTTFGLVAQEAVDIVPELVSVGQTEQELWGMNYEKLTVVLINAIKELNDRLTALEAK